MTTTVVAIYTHSGPYICRVCNLARDFSHDIRCIKQGTWNLLFSHRLTNASVTGYRKTHFFICFAQNCLFSKFPQDQRSGNVEMHPN